MGPRQQEANPRGTVSPLCLVPVSGLSHRDPGLMGSHLQQKLGVGDLLRPSALTQCREHGETLQASVLGVQLGAGGEGGVEAREPQSDCRGHVRGHRRASPSWSQLWPPALPEPLAPLPGNPRSEEPSVSSVTAPRPSQCTRDIGREGHHLPRVKR